MRKRTREIDAESLSALREAAQTSRDLAVRLRARVALAFFEGGSYVEIRRQFEIAPLTISRWIDRFRSGGVAGFRDKAPVPRAAPNREHSMEWLPTVVHQPPRSLGIPEDRWTLRTLSDLCYAQTGQRHSQECIRLALHALGHSWKRAKQTITSPDEEYEAKRGQ